MTMQNFIELLSSAKSLNESSFAALSSATGFKDDQFRRKGTVKDDESVIDELWRERQDLSAMKIVPYPFMVIAAAGFILSVMVHVYALSGLSSPLGSAAWGLHTGVFVVWVPVVLLSQKLLEGHDRKDSWKVVMRGCPAWMRYFCSVLLAYAIVNFLVFAAVAPGKQALTAAAELRGFSGHWMVFYFMAFSVLYSWLRINSTEK